MAGLNGRSAHLQLKQMQEETIQNIKALFEHLVNKLQPQNRSTSLVVAAPPKQHKIHRKPNMTYFEFLSMAVREAPRNQLGQTYRKSTYKLYEDIEILLQLANKSQIKYENFEELAEKGHLNRTAQSIRTRFQQTLSRVQQRDIKNIVDYVEANGVEGYLVNQHGEIKIVKTDPRENKDGKRVRPSSTEREQARIQKQVKRVVTPQCTELNNILSVYSKMVGVPVSDLLEKLDQLSGDLTALDKFIETRDTRMLWTEEDDKILYSKKDNTELQILRRYRGDHDIEQRKQYLGL